ncbi:MAG: ABC transporter permease [Clostridia bacterium]|nr:ABC transporter permease [Clostridia bacterium]
MRKFWGFCIIVVALVFVYLPIIVLAVYSFTESKSLIWSGFSIEPYLSLFSSSELINMLVNTAVLALLAAAIATILGTIGAIGIFYNKKILGKFTSAASRIPVINAEIVTAISLAFVFSFVFLRGTYFSLLIGHVVICVPFVVLSVLPKLKQMDSSLYEAALDLGATPTQALFKVVLPEILPGVISGFLLAITLSLDDYMVSAYNKPDGFETISTFVYKALAKPRNAALAELRALSSIIFVVMVIGVLIINFRSGSKYKKSKIKENRR